MGYCKERAAILLIYARAVSAYADSIAALRKHLPNLGRSEFERLYEAAERKRAAAEDARLALEHHIREHQCED
jgi:hypothetical protein